MAISVFDLFSIGIGPSSSHTVGPMKAARIFADDLRQRHLLTATVTIKAELYGSLGATGKGHGSDKAVMLGLEGDTPENVATESVSARLEDGMLRVMGRRAEPALRRQCKAVHHMEIEYGPFERLFAVRLEYF